MSRVTHPLERSPLWGSYQTSQQGLPTNAFWTNFVLDSGLGNVGVYPYIVAVSEKYHGLRVSLPRQLDGSTCVMDSIDDDLVIGAAAEPTNRHVSGFDDLSVTLVMEHSSDASISYALVRGSPFISANYSRLAPVIRTTHVVLSVNNLTSEGALETDTLRISMNNDQVNITFSCEIFV